MACRAKVFKCATSLGGVESVLEHHKTGEIETTDTSENLIRVSIGIQNVEDLIADLARMLD